MPNIYDKTFLRKWLRARSLTFFAKNYIFNVCEGSNHAQLTVSFSCTVHNAAHEDTVVCKNKFS